MEKKLLTNGGFPEDNWHGLRAAQHFTFLCRCTCRMIFIQLTHSATSYRAVFPTEHGLPLEYCILPLSHDCLNGVANTRVGRLVSAEYIFKNNL